MKKNNFEIGDKVKVYKTEYWHQGNKVGKVIELTAYIWVAWGERGAVTPYLPNEIYKVNVKGQQLVFSFMEGD